MNPGEAASLMGGARESLIWESRPLKMFYPSLTSGRAVTEHTAAFAAPSPNSTMSVQPQFSYEIFSSTDFFFKILSGLHSSRGDKFEFLIPLCVCVVYIFGAFALLPVVGAVPHSSCGPSEYPPPPLSPLNPRRILFSGTTTLSPLPVQLSSPSACTPVSSLHLALETLGVGGVLFPSLGLRSHPE